MAYSIQRAKEECPHFPSGIYSLNENQAYSLFLQSAYPDQPLQFYEEQVGKSPEGTPLVRNLANMDRNRQITWRLCKTGDMESTQTANFRDLFELRAKTYEVLVDGIKVHEQKLRHGGVYSLIIGTQRSGDIVTKMIEVTKPNYMSILWLIPQYVLMTLGEVMFSVTGLEFSYSQSPVTMKSVLQACWLLTVAFGNVIVVIVAELKFFNSQATEFFLFAGLMFIDMILFMWMAYRYKSNNPVPEISNREHSKRYKESFKADRNSVPTASRQARYTKR